MAYLMRRIDLSAIIPCLSLTMLQYIRNDGLIEKSIRILRYFTACMPCPRAEP